MNYTVDYFIQKFEAIPEERWCGDGAIHKWKSDQHCAYGHCGLDGAKTDEGKALTRLVMYNLKGVRDGVANINDGLIVRYSQPTPKQRILAALYDIKKMQQPTHKDETSKFTSLIPIVDEVLDGNKKELSIYKIKTS